MHDRAWYERRLTGFGASDAPVALGISRFRTARGLVEEKARRIIPDPDAPERIRLRVGREMEPVLARHAVELALERGLVRDFRPFRRSAKLHRSRNFPWMISNVDGFVDGTMVELKTDAFGYEPWGDEAGDPAVSVPAMYYTQVQHGLEATGRDRALLFVLIGLHDRKLYEIPADADFQADLGDELGRLWANVEEARARLDADPAAAIDDLLPPLDGSAASEEWIRRRYPRHDDLILSATAEQARVIGELRELERRVKDAELAAAATKNRIREWIGENAGISSPDGTITNRLSADSTDVAWEAIAGAYRKLLERVGELHLEALDVPLFEAGFTSGSLADALDTVQGLHTSTRAGSRRFIMPRGWTKA